MAPRVTVLKKRIVSNHALPEKSSVSSNVLPERDQLAMVVPKEPKKLAKLSKPASQEIKVTSKLAARDAKDRPNSQAEAAVVVRKPLATVAIPILDGGNVASKVTMTRETAVAATRKIGQKKSNSI